MKHGWIWPECDRDGKPVGFVVVSLGDSGQEVVLSVSLGEVTQALADYQQKLFSGPVQVAFEQMYRPRAA